MLIGMPKSEHRARLVIVIGFLSLSIILWLHGLLSSQIFNPEIHIPKRKAAALLREGALDRTREMQLARAYWLRYNDVRTDPFFGENGLLGLTGAAEHYRQHGRREGRIYGPVAEVRDPGQEQLLAEAYWQRYPAIAESSIWGRKSALGIRGPRDHYRYIGKYQRLVWGPPGVAPESIPLANP